MFSFLSGSCLKYSPVTKAKVHPGANIGRRIKVIKKVLPGAEPLGSRWTVSQVHADPGTSSFIYK